MQACGNVFRPFYGAKLSPRRLKYKLRRKEQRESRWKRPFFEKATTHKGRLPLKLGAQASGPFTARLNEKV
jgi:hypothetical protein